MRLLGMYKYISSPSRMADRQILTNTNGVVVRISSFWSRLVRTARWHRRVLSAALFGCAVLLVTHDPRMSEQCDRTLTLVDGRLESDTLNPPR